MFHFVKGFRKTLAVSAISLLYSTISLNVYAADAPPPSPIKVDTVKSLELGASADFMGTVHSKMHVAITAGVNGRVEWIAEPGSFIKSGEKIVTMDMLPLKLKRAEQIGNIKRAKINANYLKNEANRWKTLHKTDAASQFQLDQTTSEYELALVDIEIAELKLQQIEDEITRATIKAPYDGVVTERMVLAGTEINRSDVLGKFLDTEHLEARVYIPIKYLANVRRGHNLSLMTEQQTLSAKITAVIPSADPRSQTFEVRIEIPSHLNEMWASGQLVKVTVPVQSAKPTLTVHRDALILRKDGTYVVKVNDDNKVNRLLVKVGQGTSERVSITGDLADGDRVATRGAERLRDGQEVIIQ
ncbi:efflux RND transporter periplasmic adaptor subunit [Thalassotalea atypica]|uniref:efflux RND transporter periplasmic adaptor subunit n=1 Tax=Thalassotalea atypica TaxID=2054316 RepID=UPI002573D837|nr:efflux RND transporter periplasmic adaptor subunit [Thalassotalea atypica]